jgi:hypothetical protein
MQQLQSRDAADAVCETSGEKQQGEGEGLMDIFAGIAAFVGAFFIIRFFMIRIDDVNRYKRTIDRIFEDESGPDLF